MHILERTTTEEYDEDGRLTSRTTVEKYAPSGDLPDVAEEVFAKVLKWPRVEYLALFDMMCADVKTNTPLHWKSMTGQDNA